MTEADTAWWAHLWGAIEQWAFLGVVVALAIEFAALKFGEPYKEKLDNLREERVAAANERAAKAELDLAKFRAPRQFDEAAFVKALAGKPQWPVVEILYVDAADCLGLAGQIMGALSAAKWNPAIPKPLRGVNPGTEFPAEFMPVVTSYGGQTIGVSVVAKTATELGEEIPFAVLVRALAAELPSKQANAGRDSSMAAGTLRIIVAPKQ